MEDILLPSTIEFIPGENENGATLVISPCFQGYGTTLGNALRRVLLSSLPGAAVIALKIKGVDHEFAPIPGVKEDGLEVVLNLKQLRLRKFSDEPVRLTLKKKGEGEVTAADIKTTSDVEIVNKDLHIATITDKKAVFEMEIVVGNGRGYDTVEEREEGEKEIGLIGIDAVYTPIREVGYSVENIRVGDITNFDKLVMEIETDGTITPEEAVDQSVRILLDHFLIIQSRGELPADDEAVPDVAEEEVADEEAEEAAGEEASDEKKDKKSKKSSK